MIALEAHAAWYIRRFGECKPEWYVFPAGKGQPNDPTRPVTSLKTAWTKVREKAKVVGRWHDNRHTLVTELCRVGRGRRGDHEHRRARLARHAIALLPRADGSEAARPRRNRHSPERRRPRAQGGSRAAATGCGGFSIVASVIASSGRRQLLLLTARLSPQTLSLSRNRRFGVLKAEKGGCSALAVAVLWVVSYNSLKEVCMVVATTVHPAIGLSTAQLCPPARFCFR